MPDETIRNANREAGRLHAQAHAVIARMYSEGQALRLNRGLGPTWQLSPSGKQVDAGVAAVVIADPDVVSAGDGLFADGPAQTWRLVEPA